VFRISARAVLELGSELISSDIIAFYELVKNSFDAHSTTGVDIRFRVALRRNAYLQLRARAIEATQEAPSGVTSTSPHSLERLKTDVETVIDRSAAGSEPLGALTAITDAVSLADFVERLDEAYQSANAIEVLDTGEGMSLDALKENYLVIGTASRKRAIDAAVTSGQAKAPYLTRLRLRPTGHGEEGSG
jgi:hypothetical protein